MKVAVVKYNAGNTQSLGFALNRLGVAYTLTDDPHELASADKVIFPGQGEASSAMAYLRHKGLDKVLIGLKQPFLGVCLGMQLMCTYSEENNTDCLGILPGKVRRFDDTLKVPHMGWNTITQLRGPLFEGINEGAYMYFVHSYYVEVTSYTTAVANYGVEVSTALQKDNFYAIQPHPEKSADAGMKFLENFINL
ncbi:MAG: imidazole glycerol phosphate synthase subunit HisH [Cyclobacteriaceae bacterium]|nr:imidazole glycerol phosphate synthase subunit HisH [Cyclobacteriaceae bacterium]